MKTACAMAFAIALFACAPAASTPEIFERGVVSTEDWESHPAFSPDGLTLLIVKSDAQFGDWKIYESHLADGEWSAPLMASFSGEHLDADPFFSADGRTLYFVSDRPAPDKTGEDLDIWSIVRGKDGWGEARRLPAPVNSSGNEWFPRVLADGRLYFGSDREGGLGRTDIYVGRPIAGGFAVEILGEPVSTKDDEYEFEIAPDGSFAVLMADRAGGLGGGDLYIVYRDGEGWSAPVNLGPSVNSANLEVGPTISRDGKKFYWSSARDISRRGDIYALPMKEVLKLAHKAGVGCIKPKAQCTASAPHGALRFA